MSRAIVTGASGGLGLEFAKLLAAAGYDLVLVARSADKLTAIAADLQNRHRVNVETLPIEEYFFSRNASPAKRHASKKIHPVPGTALRRRAL